MNTRKLFVFAVTVLMLAISAVSVFAQGDPADTCVDGEFAVYVNFEEVAESECVLTGNPVEIVLDGTEVAIQSEVELSITATREIPGGDPVVVEFSMDPVTDTLDDTVVIGYVFNLDNLQVGDVFEMMPADETVESSVVFNGTSYTYVPTEQSVASFEITEDMLAEAGEDLVISVDQTAVLAVYDVDDNAISGWEALPTTESTVTTMARISFGTADLTRKNAKTVVVTLPPVAEEPVDDGATATPAPATLPPAGLPPVTATPSAPAGMGEVTNYEGDLWLGSYSSCNIGNVSTSGDTQSTFDFEIPAGTYVLFDGEILDMSVTGSADPAQDGRYVVEATWDGPNPLLVFAGPARFTGSVSYGLLCVTDATNLNTAILTRLNDQGDEHTPEVRPIADFRVTGAGAAG